MNPYMMPMDYTGYGPAQSGFFPTAAQVHQAEMQRFYTSKAAQAMQFQDPWIREFAAGAARAAGANPNDPVAMRRQMYGTPAGQMALDAATVMRSTGLLGQGNPMAYSYHVSRGITSGGFGVNVIGAGGMSGPSQIVYGSGVLSDRMTVTAQNALMQELYGPGTADPSKLNGMNMESAGFMSAMIARNRGPAMNAMTVIQNATMGQRVAEAMQTHSFAPNVVAGLGKLSSSQLERMQALSASGNAKDIEAFSNTFDDPTLKQVTRELMTAKDKSAAFLNSKWVKDMGDAIKGASSVVASLRDVYEGFNDSQLAMQAESLTGIRITSASTARRQQRMIDNLKSGAMASGGIDANSYMSFMQGAYSGFGGELSSILGLGAGGAQAGRQLEGLFMSDAGGRAGVGHQLEMEQAARAGALGMGGGSARDESSIVEDIKEGQRQFSRVHEGIKSLAGAKNRLLSKEDRAEADRILRQFSSASDPSTRNALEREARNLLGKGHGGYSRYRTTNLRDSDVTNVGENVGGAGDYVTENIARLRMADVNVSSLRPVLGDDARAFMEAGGSAALVEMEEISRGSESNKIANMIQGLVQKGGMSEQQARSVVGRLYDSSGKSLRGKDDMAALYATMRGLNPDITATGYGRTAKATADLLQMDKAGNDFRNAVKQDMSLKGIANAMISGQTGLLDSDQGKLALIQAMKGDNIKIMGKSGTDLTDKVLTGLDVNKGFSADMVAKINAATGMDLAGAAGYKSTDELVKASTTDPGLARIIGKLKDDGRLSVTGGRSSLNIVSADALSDIDSAGQVGRFKEYALAARFVSGSKDVDGLMESFRAGKPLDIGLAADSGTGVAEKSWWDWLWSMGAEGGNAVGSAANLGRFNKTASNLAMASDGDVTALMKTESGKQLMAQLKSERAALSEHSAAGRTEIETLDPDSKSVSKVNTAKQIEVLDALLVRLEKLSTPDTMSDMRVTHLYVENKR